MSQSTAGLKQPKACISAAVLFLLLLLQAPATAQSRHVAGSAASQQESGQASAQIRVPRRPAEPLFKNKQGKQKTEIYFDPATHVVTLKLLVQDLKGNFIPNIKRDNIVIYENGVRQENVSVEVEHAAVTLGVLLELGGRAQALNKILAQGVAAAGSQLLDAVGRDDTLTIWKYGDKVEKLGDSSHGREALETLFFTLGAPEFSEVNLYDSLIFAVRQMGPVTGRKAVVLISSGIDTFSQASYEDALHTVSNSDAPVYVIGTTPIVRNLAQTFDHVGPLARVDWDRADLQLQEFSRASGGRAYFLESTSYLAPIYDDMMENLRVRYVIRYRSSIDRDLNTPRTVRVELVDPKTGKPLRIVDPDGKRITAHVVLQDTYVPSATVRQSQTTLSPAPDGPK